MGIIPKALMHKLIIEVAAHTNDTWGKKEVWTHRILLIMFNDVEVNVFKVFLLSVFMEKVWTWESQKVQDEIASYEAPRKPPYNLSAIR